MFKYFHIFVASNITQWRGDLPISAGIFIPVILHIRRFRTPVWSVNAPNSAIVLLDSGKGEAAYILPILVGYLKCL